MPRARLSTILLAVVLCAWGQSPALREALSALERGDFAAARQAAELAVRAEPRSALAWKSLGMAFAADDRLEEARGPFSKACQLQPREPGACYYHGRTAYFLSRLDEAAAAFDKALKLPVDRPRATLGMALVMEARGKPADAESWFQQALERKAPDAQREYGLYLYRHGRHQEGINHLRKAGASEDLARVERELRAAPQPAASTAPLMPLRFEPQPLPVVSRNHAAGNKHLIETMMGGVAILDFDGDGWPDIYVTNGAPIPSLEKHGPPDWNRLFRNRGDGSFDDVTEAAGVSGHGYSMGAATADFDGDGHIDLFVAGVRQNTLYRNRGDGTFEDVTASAGVAGDGQWSIGAAWLDFDRDGLLDLFVARYVQWDPAAEPYCGDRQPGHRTYCHPRLYRPLPNLLYRNEGGGRFRDVSLDAGVHAHPGKAMGLAVADFNQDGWPDLFIGNDALPNSLFLNHGGKFQEVAAEQGIALPNDGRPVSSMGAAIGDFDQDGHIDLLVTTLSNETFPFFRNLGDASFEDITAPSGIAALTLPYSGWGAAFVDLDNDGWPDIFTANGHVMDNAELTSSRPSRQPNLVLRNQGGARFTAHLLPATADVPAEAFHRGLAVADLNRDGRMDLVVTRLNEAPLILWNRTPTQHHWLMLELEGNPVGARVRAKTAAGTRLGLLAPFSSYASSSQPVVHLGLGPSRQVDELTIFWPDGCQQVVTGIQADQHLRLPRSCPP